MTGILKLLNTPKHVPLISASRNCLAKHVRKHVGKHVSGKALDEFQDVNPTFPTELLTTFFQLSFLPAKHTLSNICDPVTAVIYNIL